MIVTKDGNTFFDGDALLDRLTDGAKEANRKIVFVVGAPLTAPVGGEGPGVADVSAVVQLIRDEFARIPRQAANLDRELEQAPNKYQAAFTFLQGHRSQDVANRIIRTAVWRANKGDQGEDAISALQAMSEEQLTALDKDEESWALSPGVAALGGLVARFPVRFGGSVITSNFDPLIEVAVSKSGGAYWRTSLYVDGNLDQSRAEGCQVVHLHGFWHGSDTLHTGNQLIQKRPFLKSSLLNLLADKTVVVLAYGGWQDIFTEALGSLISDPANFPEVLWCFFSSAPNLGEDLKETLTPGLQRNRITLYHGIDCHSFLPMLLSQWENLLPTENKKSGGVSTVASARIRSDRAAMSDRPPAIEAWVGREAELRALEASRSKVIALSGIGGEGKSVLAARYISSVERGETDYIFWDWRDCREEGDRLRTQILAAIERLSGSPVVVQSARGEVDADIAQMFVELCSENKGVFVLDNVDAYVDLERNVYTGLLDLLVKEACRAEIKSLILITCRPTISYDLTGFIALPLKGLSLEETTKLFYQRGALNLCTEAEVSSAHAFTRGHAFWLDLMALQIARVPGKTLRGLIENIKRGRDEVPDLLSTIWPSLLEREQTVLRAMAELKRPEAEQMIERVLSGALTYSKFGQAMRALVRLNLVVIKQERNAPDQYDLHPLVRQFVISNFRKQERVGYIQTVLKQYVIIIKGMAALLGVYTPISMLERWSQKAELEIEAGQTKDAFRTLFEAKRALLGGGHSEEFVRVARKLFESIDWLETSNSVEFFDQVLRDLVECLEELEESNDADDLLTRYAEIITAKTARYINLCDARCHSYWRRGDFILAIEWGVKGDDLKQRSNVDTLYSCEHNLALARRDGGQPREALEVFLKGRRLEDLLNDDIDVNLSDGPLYGNVGRCLQFLGRREEALICYKKSARLLEDDEGENRLGNQAYARHWISEILIEQGENKLGAAFLIEAEKITRNIAPGRARSIQEALQLLDEKDVAAARNSSSKCVESWIRH